MRLATSVGIRATLTVVLLALLLVSTGCSQLGRPLHQLAPQALTPTVPPLEAAEDPANVVSIEPSASLTNEASNTPWPADAADLRGRWRGIVFRKITTPDYLVALTFDDGPRAGMMIRATDMLVAAGARATFFCVGGRVLHDPAETRYAFTHGMEIENHTWSHRELNRPKAEDLIQILSADSIIGEVTGTRPLWVRPKSGLADATGTAAVAETGHLMAGWNVHAGDTGTWTAQQITQHVLDGVRPGDVVDLHVTNPRTLEALPGILDGLKSRSYKMVTLSQLALAAR